MSLAEIGRPHAAALTALVIVTALYAAAREPALSAKEVSDLAAPFRFTKMTLPDLPGAQPKYIRSVHPSLRRISAWISSVGAAVSLSDLDADGLPNDVCRVDPRTDEVIVEPAPGTGWRYAPFSLEPPPALYDRATMAPMGCVSADLNEDGLVDLLVYYWGRTPMAFLRAAGTPGVREALEPRDFAARDIVPSGERWFSNAGFVADLDGDGHLDIVIGNYFKDGARILDANADGVESLHNTKSRSFNGGSKRVLRWTGATPSPNPSVTFDDVPGIFDERVAHGWTLAAGAADLDGDLLPEIYFANDFGPDRLLHNRSTPGHIRFTVVEGAGTFTSPKSLVLGRDSFKGMGLDFADVNRDGVPDIYVSNIADVYALQESHFLWLSTGDMGALGRGRAPYVHASEAAGLARSGWGWDARLDDFNNDGQLEAVQATGFIKGEINRWPELQALGTGNDSLMDNPYNWPGFRAGDDLSGDNTNAFFVRAADGRFYNVGDRIGFDQPMVSRGIAIADVDGDGRLDFAVANQWQPSYLFRNGSRPGEYLGLHLVLPLEPGPTRERRGHPGPDMTGRPAVGAEATIRYGGHQQIAIVDGGNGHSGKRSADLHFGLSPIETGVPVRVELRWRDPRGQPHREVRQLVPGWHTISLGWTATEGTR